MSIKDAYSGGDLEHARNCLDRKIWRFFYHLEDASERSKSLEKIALQPKIILSTKLLSILVAWVSHIIQWYHV